ncbi:hypothetical protein KSS87_012165 [Heliosperma pusillum]|nr:hypothetical protein KSS87_012165 [Heliosperma pusillum]
MDTVNSSNFLICIKIVHYLIFDVSCCRNVSDDIVSYTSSNVITSQVVIVEANASQSVSEISAIAVEVPVPVTSDVIQDNVVEELVDEEVAEGSSSNRNRTFDCPIHLKPSIGMVFDKLELGIGFYEAYAKECGFVSRLRSQKVSKDVVTHKACLCNKAGECEAKGTKQRRQRTRISCPARGNFKRIPSGQYQIYAFVEGHNHMPQTPLTMVHLTQTRELNIEELKAACFSCGVEDIQKDPEHAIQYISIIDRERDKVYVVGLKTDESKIVCTCKKFERHGILSRHALCVLRERGFKEVPSEYLINRWSKLATCKPIFSSDGQLLTDCRSVEVQKNKVSELWSKLFTCVSVVEQSPVYCDELLGMLRGFKERVLAVTSVIDDSGNSGIGKKMDKNAEIGMLLGTSLPSEIKVLPPRQCKNKGSGKRLISQREKAGEVSKRPLRRCKACGEMANHDSRNCDKKTTDDDDE